MSFRSGTATDHEDLFDLLIDFLTDAVVDNGCGWTANRMDSEVGTGNPARCELTAPGLSDDEEINSVFSLYEDVGADTYALGFRMSPDWNSGLAWNFQTNQSTEVFQPIWDAPMDYWFAGNKQRVVVVTKVSTVFTSSYVGRFLPYGSKQEYGLPWFCGANVGASTTRWSDTSESSRAFFDPTFAYMLDPSGTWRLARNFFEQSGSETGYYAGVNIWPNNGGVSGGEAARDFWIVMRDNVDGTYPLFPFILQGQNSSINDIYGELDGVYAVPGFSIGAGDDITIGGDTYRVFQNIFRTSRWHYAAVKEA
jgi:hypothetical protein